MTVVSDEDFEMVDAAFDRFQAGLLPDLRSMEADVRALRRRGLHNMSVARPGGSGPVHAADNALGQGGAKGLATDHSRGYR